ncbi:hypothetical protein BDZ97DRAFT_2075219 [Flammula alnicola]|nr:hypothetical protein BDZ97DRAFT_2075219 [Flammula alnicola]
MIHYILNFNLFAVLLSMAVLIHGRASPSGTPTSYVCPPADLAGFPLGSNDVNENPIFCSYPAFAGENPNDFFCTYSQVTGALEDDHDAGFCPGSAVPVTITSKGRRNAHAPLPTRPQNIVHGIPDGPTDKTYLKKRRAVSEPAL